MAQAMLPIGGMTISLTPKKVVWAIDPFEQITDSQRHASQLVRALQERLKATVQPVYVLSPAELNLSAEFAGHWVSHYQPAAEKALAQAIIESKLETLEPSKIILQGATSTAKAADALVQFCGETGAELIVVGTHGRTGMSRLLLGSFAETLMMRSRIPVMVVGPHLRSGCTFDQVLFPSEFGETSKTTFKKVVALARDFGAKVILYHAIPRPIEPVYQSGVYLMGSPWIPIQEYYGHEVARHERHAQIWARWAKGQGVETEVVIDTDTLNIAESIIQLARLRKVGWIAMAAHSGPIATAILGSITRQVIRIAETPVWIMHWPRKRKHDAAERKFLKTA